MDKVIAIFWFFLIISVAVILGKRILKKIGVNFDSFLEEFCFSIGFGLAIFSFLTFFLGIAGLLDKRIFILLLVICFTAFFKEIFSQFFIIKDKLLEFISARKNKKVYLFIIFCLGILFLFSFINALAPPIGWDDLTYHLTMPKIFIKQHRIGPLPFLPHVFSVLNIEMLYMFGMLIANETVAKLFPILFGFLTIACIYTYGRKFFSEEIGIYAAFLFATMPVVVFTMAYNYAELALAFYVILSFYAFFNWFKYDTQKNLFISAALIGFCAGIKYSGAILLPILILGIFYKDYFVSKKRFGRIFREILSVMFIVGLIGSVLYIKNYIDTGNPISPYMANFFQDKYATLNPYYDVGSVNIKQIVLNVVKFLWMVNIQRDWMESSGPFYLFFLPLFLFFKHKNNHVKLLLGYGLGCVFFYLLVIPPNYFYDIKVRYFSPFFPPISILCAYFYNAVILKDKILKKVLNIFIVFYVSLILFLHISKTALKIPVVLGLENKDKYLGRMINTYGAIEYANHHLSDSSLVLFIGTRGYYFKIPFIMAQDYNRYVYNEFCTPQDFLKRLKELKVTHLLLDLYNDNIHTREIRRLLESNKDFLKPENFVLLYQGSDTFFYEVRY